MDQSINTGFGDLPDWTKNLPGFSIAPPPAQPQGNPLVAGFMSGVHGLVGDVGGLTQAVGTATGLDDLAGAGKRLADSQEASSNQRRDLDFGQGSLPWYSPSKLAYNVGKAVPGIGSMVVAGLATPEAAVPAWLARAGEAAPALLGGGEGLGTAFGRSVLGAGAAALPGAVAGNVKTAEEGNQGAPMSREQAVAAIGLGVPEAAMAGMFPASLGHGGGAGLPSKILKGAATGGLVNATQSAISTALSSFLGDPNTPIAERAQNVVQSALSGGLVGAVFGGAFGPFHGGEPENTKPPGEVTNPDLEQSTAFLAQPPGTQGELSLGQNRQTASPIGPVQPAGSLGSIATPDLMSQFSDLARKGGDRSASEDAYHAILGQELAARTPPGLEPGQGTLFTPEQMGERVPLIAAMKAKVVPESAQDSSFAQSFNATNEPELVNYLRSSLNTGAPKWAKDLGKQYGIGADGVPADVVGALNTLNDKLNDLDTKRQAAAKAGDQEKFAAINTQMSRTKDAITKAEGLVDLHNQANDLIAPPTAVGPDGQLNLPGLGVADTGVPRTDDANQLDLFNPAQVEALTPEETGARQEAMRQFQARVAPGLPEGTLNAHDMPSLVRDLQSKIVDYDAAGVGPKQWHPEIKALAEATGLVDKNGTPRDLAVERKGLYDQYEALWRQAGDKRDPNATDATRAKAASDAQALKAPGGPIDRVEELQDLHAAAEKDAPIDVPGRVRSVYAKIWKTLEAAKSLRADDKETNSKIVKTADTAQKAIETNSKTAEQSGKFAINQISGLVRDRAKVDMEAPRVKPAEAQPVVDLGEPGKVKAANKNRPDKAATEDATTKRQYDKLSKVQDDIKARAAEMKNPTETTAFKAALEPEPTSVPVKEVPVKGQAAVKARQAAKLAKAAAPVETEAQTRARYEKMTAADVIKGLEARYRGAGRVLPDLTETQAPKASTLESKVRNAAAEITKGALNAPVQLKDLRAKLPDVSREELNAVLVKLHETEGSGIHLGRSDNPMDRSAERDAEGIPYKGELEHYGVFNPAMIADAAPPIKTVKPLTDLVQARAELQALHDAEPEGSPQKLFMAKALATGKLAPAKSALSAIQIAKGFFRDEGGSVDLGAIAKSFSKLSDKLKQSVADKVDQPLKPGEVKASNMAENRPTTSPAQAEGRVQDTQSVATLAMHNASEIVRDVGSSAPVWLRKAALIAETMSGVVRIAGKYLKSAAGYRDLHEQKQAISSVKNKVDSLAARAYLEAKPEVRALVDDVLQRLNDGSGLDIRKPLDNTSLLDEDGKLVSNAAELQARHKEGVAVMSRLQRAGGRSILDSHLQMMQTKGYQELAATLSRFGEVWSAKNQGRLLQGHGVNPDEVFQFRPDLHDSTAGTMKFYADSARAMRVGIKAELDNRTKAAATFMKTDPKKAAAMLGDVADLKSALAHANERLIETDRGTYSPLGHGDGDYFVAGKAKDGKSMAAIQKVFEDAGFHNIGFFHDSDSSTIMTRLDSMTKMERVANLMKGLEASGHLVEGSTKNGHPDTPGAMQGVVPRFMQGMIEDIQQAVDRSGAVGDVADGIKARLIRQLMDTLPDHSIIPNLRKRNYVSGFSKDMGEVGINRAINSSRASTNTSMAGKTAAALAAMRTEVDNAKGDASLSPKEKLIGADAHRELMLREAQQAWNVPHSGIDTIRSITHTVGIGANIGYTVLPLSQIMTLSHGELAKKYGHVAAAKALGASATEAFWVMKVMARSKDWASLGFRESDLKAAGIRQSTIDIIMRLENMGGLSSYTRMMSDLGEGANSKEVKFKNYANALGSYAETYPRIITALAAAKLHDANPGKAGLVIHMKDVDSSSVASTKADIDRLTRAHRDAYIKNVVDESQFRWGGGETSRLTGGKGPLGSFGKLAFAFTQFKTKMIEKLYSEVHDLIKGDNPENTRMEAGRFLVSHMAATVALAGTLGLPAASMVAGVFDKLYTAFTGDQTMDVEGAYRTWLAHTYGGNVADVLAKGLPRALGLDLSKLGEQTLLPFSELVQDKRKFEDVTEDWFHSMAGAAIGELGEAYLGMRDIANGDYMIGLQKALPGTLKDVVEAAYLSQHGFINRQGQKEPIPATTQAIIQKAMGFKTSNEAQYDEASKIASGLKAQRQYVSQNIGTHLNRAALTGNQTDLATWMNAAIQFQQENPLVPGPLQSFGRSLQQRMMGQSMSQAFDTPLGLKPYDPIARRVGFGMTQQ